MLESHQPPPYWTCFACQGSPVTFQTGELLMGHIKTSHPQTISEDQLSTLVDMCQQKDPPVFERCPLCPWAEEQAMREHLRDKHGSTADINGPVFLGVSGMQS